MTKNGLLSTPFDGVLCRNNDTFTGTIGAQPDITVKKETRNGDIKVKQGRRENGSSFMLRKTAPLMILSSQTQAGLRDLPKTAPYTVEPSLWE